MHLRAFPRHPPAGERSHAVYTTAVAIDKDKNSQLAVKWAVDNLLMNSPAIVLIHVRSPANISLGFSMSEVTTEAVRERLESEMNQLFLPYRGFCARKGMQLKEVVLEETDVAKSIIEYIDANTISNIVVGSSNRNVITRKFRNPDVATSLMKSAPDFSTVYVISKGKPATVRSAKTKAHIPAALPQQPSIPPSPRHFAPGGIDSDDTPRMTLFSRAGGRRSSVSPSFAQDRRSIDRNPDYVKTPSRDRVFFTARTESKNAFFESRDVSFRPPRSSSRESFAEDLDFHRDLGFQLTEFTDDHLEHSAAPTDSPRSSSSYASRDMEAELNRLRLELNQTIEMYSSACKEAIRAKQKAREVHQWKLKEARKIEEARQAEEAALQMVEMEKARCRAAIEAAQEAQMLVEIEAKRRLCAERAAKREAEERKRALDALAHKDVRYRKYTIEEVEVATNFFSESLKIGEGGYGPVYKACLDHTPVAIKVLRPDATQGRRQFKQEVEVLSRIRHPNMVLLLGACPEYGCLVYEYMNNGSLEDRLFRRGNTPPIPWSVRFKLAAEIATGLLFLHQTKPEPLVHRDLKPANILLDRNYVSKISDVGLARLVPPATANAATQYRMTSTAGTFCYIDPEYQQTGMLGVKSDIYSMGIMLLQIVTAKPPMGLTHRVESAIERGAFAEVLDPTVPDWPVEETLGFAKLALKCAELKRKDRPDLAAIVLPELNRLRNLGQAWEATCTSSSGSGQSFVREATPSSLDVHLDSRSHHDEVRHTDHLLLALILLSKIPVFIFFL
ncbi:unnamed protein product [Spirodela intermedia]|uniref:RING-type E3 ubiquitin transferase n=1 Tax=Spirodela intermedia TaxID=51605 RepID=A0A7I8LFM5_SPIIN|nr:unnamed protein product [Spirodela intermedia]